VGTANFLSAEEKANCYYYTSAFAAFIVASLFAALAWMTLLRNLNVKTTVRRAFLFTWAGYFLDSTTPEPGWSGDLSKAYMLSKKSNEDVGKVAASVIGQKLISMILTVVILALGVGILALKYVLPGFVIGFLVGVFVIALVSLAVVFYVSTSPKATQKMLDLLIAIGSFILRSRWDAVCFRARAERTLKTFHDGIGSLSANRRAFIRPVVLCGLSLAFDISVVALTFAALGSSVPIDTVLIVYVPDRDDTVDWGVVRGVHGDNHELSVQRARRVVWSELLRHVAGSGGDPLVQARGFVLCFPMGRPGHSDGQETEMRTSNRINAKRS
jgi:uncharacterized protein (TIRG00374 family)